MSHIAEIKLEIKDLEALKTAAEKLGLEFREGQKTYNWYGTKVGEDPLPTGFTKKDLGKCEHAMSVPGNSEAYEIGIARRRDGKPGYVLLWDYWMGGYGLADKVGGQDGRLLKQEYGVAVASKQARRDGWRVQRTDREGKVHLRLVK